MGGQIIEKMRKQYGIHWVGVKFYQFLPDKEILDLYYDKSQFRFCEAINKAIIHPIIFKKDNLNCEPAKFIFKWSEKTRDDIITICLDKRNIDYDTAKDIIYNLEELNNAPKYIGLNTDKDPDIAIAYLNPKTAMDIVRMYHDETGQELKVVISSIMSICGNLAVKSYVTNEITLSFGCDESRIYGGIDRDSLAMCVPKSLFNLFTKDNISKKAVVEGKIN